MTPSRDCESSRWVWCENIKTAWTWNMLLKCVMRVWTFSVFHLQTFFFYVLLKLIFYSLYLIWWLIITTGGIYYPHNKWQFHSLRIQILSFLTWAEAWKWSKWAELRSLKRKRCVRGEEELQHGPTEVVDPRPWEQGGVGAQQHGLQHSSVEPSLACRLVSRRVYTLLRFFWVRDSESNLYFKYDCYLALISTSWANFRF